MSVKSHLTAFGFEFGPLSVQRTMEVDGRVVVTLTTAHESVTVYSSPAGRSLRVFKDNREELLTADRLEQVIQDCGGGE